MLNHLYIKNFTIIEQLSLEICRGLAVITGETGAGKSILIDALELILGERLGNSVVREGAERCEIAATFDVSHIATAQSWLNEHDFNQADVMNECIIRRIVSPDLRSRLTINGAPCTLQQVKELSGLLVHVHGQHQHQALLKRECQTELVDGYAGHYLLCQQVKKLYQQWRDTQQNLLDLQHKTQDGGARLDLVQYQWQELEELNLQADEVAQLHEEQRKLAGAEQLIEDCQAALDILFDNEQSSVVTQLHQVMMRFNRSLKLPAIEELVNNAIIQSEEAAAELRHYLDSLEINPERLLQVEQRLDRIHQLARKHRVEPEALAALQQKLQTELLQLQHADEQLLQLQQQLTALAQQYQATAQKLSQQRATAAARLSNEITAQMKQLGMAEARFKIDLEANKEQAFAAYGLERAEFQVSVNPGQKLQSMAKVASGGELSRISLAIQVITAQKTNAPTLIFDEVDVGIGGRIAEMVGKTLRALGEKAQVLCITHLPQVAAQGHHHFQVEKMTNKKTTQTQIKPLSSQQRVHEIARMLGGVQISEKVLAHAKEMLEEVA